MNKHIFLFFVVTHALSLQAISPQEPSHPLVAFMQFQKCIGSLEIPSWFNDIKKGSLSPLLELACYQQAYIDLWDALTPRIKNFEHKKSALKNYLERQESSKTFEKKDNELFKLDDELFEKISKYKSFSFSDPRNTLALCLGSEILILEDKVRAAENEYQAKLRKIEDKVIETAITIAKQIGSSVVLDLTTADDQDDIDYEKHLIFISPNVDITQMVIDQLNAEWLALENQSKP